jgi:hypothetical protein
MSCATVFGGGAGSAGYVVAAGAGFAVVAGGFAPGAGGFVVGAAGRCGAGF